VETKAELIAEGKGQGIDLEAFYAKYFKWEVFSRLFYGEEISRG
jgi:hypothetical protein